jgi:hypothetical protein
LRKSTSRHLMLRAFGCRPLVRGWLQAVGLWSVSSSSLPTLASNKSTQTPSLQDLPHPPSGLTLATSPCFPSKLSGAATVILVQPSKVGVCSVLSHIQSVLCVVRSRRKFGYDSGRAHTRIAFFRRALPVCWKSRVSRGVCGKRERRKRALFWSEESCIPE